MSIKDILAKLLKGDKLTDDERKLAEGFDLQKQLDESAADARRKAEAKAEAEKKRADEAESKLKEKDEQAKKEADSKKTDIERLQDTLKAVQQQLEAQRTEAAELKAAQAKAARSSKIAGLMEKAGIQFVEGVDSKVLRGAFEAALGTVKDEDLDGDAVKPFIETFRNTNKAVIRDTSGGGAGTPARDGTGGGGSPQTDAERMSDSERAKQLRKMR